MKLYLVKVDGEVDYEMYNGFVIRAESPTEAIKIAQKLQPSKNIPHKAREIKKDGKSEMILGSFNAG